MLGSGQSVDLLKLYWLMREKGGYDVVSENGLWDYVAKESGLDSGISSKLIYPKYLDALHKWLQRNVEDKDSKVGLVNNGTNQSVFVTDLELESKGVSSEISGKKKDGDDLHLDLEESKLNFRGGSKLGTGGEGRRFVELAEGKGNGAPNTTN